MSAPSCGAVRGLDTGCGEEVSELNMESGDRRSQQPDTATGAVNTGNTVNIMDT